MYTATTATAELASTDASRPGAGLSRRAYARAIAFMTSHLGDHISLHDIAGAACVSRWHFARMFRLSTGHSVMEYLLKLRIERAKYILSRQEIKIAEVSAELGFYDQSHFTRVFRRLTGTTPRAFGHQYGVDPTQPDRVVTEHFGPMAGPSGNVAYFRRYRSDQALLSDGGSRMTTHPLAALGARS